MRTPPSGPGRVPVLLAGDGAAWEASAVRALAAPGSGAVVVRRCLDLTELLAAAATGVARVAVLADRLPGLDRDTVSALDRYGVGVVVVCGGRGARTGEPDEEARRRLHGTGVARVLRAEELGPDGSPGADTLMLAVLEVAAGPGGAHGADGSLEGAEADLDPAVLLTPETGEAHGRLVAVWGPTGAPGRTTVALGLAAAWAVRGRDTLLLDADPYGGTVAQHLAVLEEVSGLLAATRLANAGRLDRPRLAAVARRVDPGLRLLTGLPRPDRWPDVRPAAFEALLEVAVGLDDVVVVDTGFGLGAGPADPYAAGPDRDAMTRSVLGRADHVVVVAAADPVGLTRLARSLRDLVDLRLPGRMQVAVNRMRPTLGWSERDVRYLVEGIAPDAAVAFLPEDRAAVDRALVAGRTLVECGPGPLTRALAALADAVLEPVTR